MKLARLALPAALLMALLPLTAGPAASADPDPSRTPRLAPLHRTWGVPVPDHYIVTLRKGASPRALVSRLGVNPDYVYTHAFTGFAATLTPEQLTTVRSAPDVVAVEQDAVLNQADLNQADLNQADRNQAAPDQADAPRSARRAAAPVSPVSPAALPRIPTDSYGLDRIDQHNPPLDNQFTVTATGEGATAYVIDTGIDYSHPDFGGRARGGIDLVTVGGDGSDCRTGSGHGTHVAGVLGSATHGVARKATLVSVRVLNCDGRTTVARFVAGLDYVARSATPASVANASIVGPASQTVNMAIAGVASRGVLPVVAAGNENDNACDHSPSGAVAALAVGATDRSDRMTDFSSYGPCVRILAPGADIVSTAMGGGTTTKSGTSQAAPFAAGVAALYKAQHPQAGSAEVANWIVNQSTKNAVTDVKAGTPNRLLYTGGL
ncbi:S8 family peptidase [Streptomyces sp. NPDC053048]|uniref:S8 family peptidase n=1 Tax=Streptomyces sp. NPDC053048 TaxID=3365694 RepID=UPI0037D04C32